MHSVLIVYFLKPSLCTMSIKAIVTFQTSTRIFSNDLLYFNLVRVNVKGREFQLTITLPGPGTHVCTLLTENTDHTSYKLEPFRQCFTRPFTRVFRAHPRALFRKSLSNNIDFLNSASGVVYGKLWYLLARQRQHGMRFA